MSLLSTLLEKVEESMTVATFAEAGEFEMARQFFKPGKNTHKRVLLSTDREEINPKSLNYAMRLCHCIGGNLEVFHLLHVPTEESAGEMAKKNGLLEAIKGAFKTKGIAYQLVTGKECLASEVLTYTKNKRDLLCVIFDSREAGGSQCQQAKETMLAKFHALHCPVVVYAEQTMA